ncbi:(d)CMP kinase, partial [Patescibacteria group bacterium]|nr:(d)CMP kinase [Patescibacteria group bacterium]
MKYVITIDGPSGGGKSTLAKNLQKELKGFVLLDTGSYYRWATYLCLENGIGVESEKDVYDYVKDRLELDFVPYKGGQSKYAAKVLYDGKDVNKKLYTDKVTKNVSVVAKYKRLRQRVRKMQRDLAKYKNLIVAGRDIGTYVFPKAKIKFYLEPSIDARTRRRYKDHVREGRATSYKELKQNIAHRDHEDTTREHSPLKKPSNALVIDNTHLLPSQTLRLALKYIYEKEPAVKGVKDEVAEIVRKPKIYTTTNNS